MSAAVTFDDVPSSAQSPETPAAPAPKKGLKGFLQRTFNAAVKAAPTAIASTVLGFSLKAAALSSAAFAGASTGVTLAAIGATSGTTAALVTLGEEAWKARKGGGRHILETLSSREVLKKVGKNFTLASGFGVLGASLAPLVIDYVKHIDLHAAASKLADFLIPSASAHDFSPGSFADTNFGWSKPAEQGISFHGTPHIDASQPAHTTIPDRPKVAAATPSSAPPAPAAPAAHAPVAQHPHAPAAPADLTAAAAPQTPPAAHHAMERIRELAAAKGSKGASLLKALDHMTNQQLKDYGVKALWTWKDPELARALFEASAADGNAQAQKALDFMNTHRMGLSTPAAAPAPTAPASPPAPATPNHPPPRPTPAFAKSGLAARCDMVRPPMSPDGLQITCTINGTNMAPGDRVEVHRPNQSLFTVFLSHASQTTQKTADFLSGRVAPSLLTNDPVFMAALKKASAHYEKILLTLK